MAFSNGLLEIYKKYYKAVIIDIKNTELSLNISLKNKNFPNRIKNYNNIEMPVLWADSLLMQKFQQYIHGNISKYEYLQTFKKNEYFNKFSNSIYCGDAEIFNFRPKSSDETEEVKAIIQLFRFHMAPELKGTNHRYMTLPSTFDIHYMYQSDPGTTKENSFYNKIATCVLERCDVNYTPTGVKSFDDGAPTEITMSLSFKETELLTKQKINDGF